MSITDKHGPDKGFFRRHLIDIAGSLAIFAAMILLVNVASSRPQDEYQKVEGPNFIRAEEAREEQQN